MINVMAPTGFEHAIYQSDRLDGQAPRDFVLGLIAKNFQGAPTSTPDEAQPFGFQLFNFGMSRGAVGFAEYRVTQGRIAVWIAAVAAADVAWAQPQTGAVAFSLHCAAAGASAPLPRNRSLALTSVSTRCIQGVCGEGDFAAQYMKVLRLGYVHAPDGSNYLIKPKSDYWQNGAEGPGYYHQVGGTNEKLEPGRTN